jgi:hypothetical protein
MSELRDMIIAWLRHPEIKRFDKRRAERLADIIEKRLFDAKWNKLHDRNVKAGRAHNERNELVASGMSVGEANNMLYRKYGRNSPGAFAKWLYRNPPRLPFRI